MAKPDAPSRNRRPLDSAPLNRDSPGDLLPRPRSHSPGRPFNLRRRTLSRGTAAWPCPAVRMSAAPLSSIRLDASYHGPLELSRHICTNYVVLGPCAQIKLPKYRQFHRLLRLFCPLPPDPGQNSPEQLLPSSPLLGGEGNQLLLLPQPQSVLDELKVGGNFTLFQLV